MGQWGLYPLAAARVRAAYKVTCDEQTVALKESGHDESRLRVAGEALAYLEQRGFWKTAPFLPTRHGEPFLRWGEALWTVAPWREGREPEYEVPEDIPRCAGTLAEFHLAGLGFQTAKVPLRSGLGKWPQKLRRRADELQGYLGRAGSSAQPAEFVRLAGEVGPCLLHQAGLARENLPRTAYDERCAWGRRIPPLCHGDPSNRNFILGSDGVVWLLDLDALKTDLPEADLCRLLRRTLRRTGWLLNTATGILDAYSARVPLPSEALGVILARLQFPDGALRLLKQYYAEGPPGEGEGESEGAPRVIRLAHKLAQVAEDLPRWERFLGDFARAYGITGFRLA